MRRKASVPPCVLHRKLTIKCSGSLGKRGLTYTISFESILLCKPNPWSVTPEASRNYVSWFFWVIGTLRALLELLWRHPMVRARVTWHSDAGYQQEQSFLPEETWKCPHRHKLFIKLNTSWWSHDLQRHSRKNSSSAIDHSWIKSGFSYSFKYQILGAP